MGGRVQTGPVNCRQGPGKDSAGDGRHKWYLYGDIGGPGGVYYKTNKKNEESSDSRIGACLGRRRVKSNRRRLPRCVMKEGRIATGDASFVPRRTEQIVGK